MTCSGSPYFRRRPSRPTRVRPRCCSKLVSNASSRCSEGEESMEDEDEEVTVPGVPEPLQRHSDDYFEFEDVEDLDEIVDFRPHGESPSAATVSPARIQVRFFARFIW